MKFYLAASRERRIGVMELIQELERRGHICTYNWALNFDQGFEDPVRSALDCLHGVADAEVVIGLLPALRGTNFELGLAWSQLKPVLLIEANLPTTGPGEFDPSSGHIFYQLPMFIRIPAKDWTDPSVEFNDWILDHIERFMEENKR